MFSPSGDTRTSFLGAPSGTHMELSISLQKHLAQSASLHKRLCPRQVLGVRMARLACIQLGIDPAIRRKRVFVYMENGHCIADGVIAVTYASPTNQLMQLVPYGKMAATFVNLDTGQAMRVCEHPQSRQTAITLLPDAPSSWKAHLKAYQVMPDDLLFSWQFVELLVTPPNFPGKHKVVCAGCGDYVHEYCEVEVNGVILCKVCAYGAYYITPESTSMSLREISQVLINQL
jgi:formylmethanofuran dehydrogenase subunit E